MSVHKPRGQSFAFELSLQVIEMGRDFIDGRRGFAPETRIDRAIVTGDFAVYCTKIGGRQGNADAPAFGCVLVAGPAILLDCYLDLLKILMLEKRQCHDPLLFGIVILWHDSR